MCMCLECIFVYNYGSVPYLCVLSLCTGFIYSTNIYRVFSGKDITVSLMNIDVKIFSNILPNQT